MRTIAIALATAAALVAAPALHAKPKLSGEQRLARILEGREAGEPVDCIPLHATRDTTVVDRTAIVYDAGSTIYVNRPVHARDLDDDDVMVVELHGSQLCKLDTVRMRDRSNFFFTGFVGLEQFVPYRKVAAARN